MRPEDVAYWQEYAKAYSYFDVKGLVVLDVGADIGSIYGFFSMVQRKSYVILLNSRDFLMKE